MSSAGGLPGPGLGSNGLKSCSWCLRLGSLEARSVTVQTTRPAFARESLNCLLNVTEHCRPKRKIKSNKKIKDPSALFNQLFQGRARMQSPTTINYAVEIPTFGEFADVSPRAVQCRHVDM